MTEPPVTPETVTVMPVTGLPEIAAGDDLAAMICQAAPDLRDGPACGHAPARANVHKPVTDPPLADVAQQQVDVDKPGAGGVPAVGGDRLRAVQVQPLVVEVVAEPGQGRPSQVDRHVQARRPGRRNASLCLGEARGRAVKVRC